MNEIIALWKPILASAVLVFIASSIIWMFLPIHKGDYKNPGAKEGPLLDALRAAALPGGSYNFPWCDHKNMKDPAMVAKLKAGPWVLMHVAAKQPNMGPMMGLWFLNLVLVGVFVAYLAGHAGLTGDKAAYLNVFRVTGTAALLAYGGSSLTMCIWHGHAWSLLPGKIFDGVVYALLTAGCFAWLWPRAVGA